MGVNERKMLAYLLFIVSFSLLFGIVFILFGYKIGEYIGISFPGLEEQAYENGTVFIAMGFGAAFGVFAAWFDQKYKVHK
jgi:hypothetical protein